MIDRQLNISRVANPLWTQNALPEPQLWPYELLLRLFASYEQQDDEAIGHQRRVARLVRLLAESLGLAEEADLYATAALFHDIGMIGPPDHGPSMPWRALWTLREGLEAHVWIGYHLLHGSGIPVLRLAAVAALCHHERFDGAGYPLRLVGTGIPLVARLVATADRLDSLTSGDAATPGYPLSIALEMLAECAHGALDPALVQTLSRELTRRAEAGGGPDQTHADATRGAATAVGWEHGVESMGSPGRHPAPQTSSPTPPPRARLQTTQYLVRSGQQGSSFHCPHCRAEHSQELFHCPSTGRKVRSFHKLSGTTVAGRYRLEEAVGAGGMGVVYQACHVFTGRSLAIKLLDPDQAVDPNSRTRFLKEAQVYAAVRHPNLVEVYDAGFAEQDLAFIAMELLSGEDLATTIGRFGTLSERSAAGIAIQLLDTLTAVHDRGIVHRDLKPENTFLIERLTRVKLMDFGLARFELAADGRRISESGLCVGTPAYMSPEQAEGGRVDARSDLFAMGCMIYELLTGRVPFAASSIGATLMAIMEGRFPPLRDLRPDVSERLGDVITRALAPDPAARFQSAGELIAALEPTAQAAPWYGRGRLVVVERALSQVLL